MVAVAAVDGHALKAVAMMRTGLTARAVVACFAHLPQKFLFDTPCFLFFALAVQFVLQNGKFVAVNLHVFCASLSYVPA